MRHLPSTLLAIALIATSACESARSPSSAASDARTSLVPASPCGADCFGIWRAAMTWVSTTRSTPPARLLVDTVTSGRSSYAGPRVVPRSTLDDVAAASGVGGRGNQDEMGRCFGVPDRLAGSGRPVPASCQRLADKILVSLSAPVVSQGNSNEASLDLAEEWSAVPLDPSSKSFFVLHVYRLTLQRDAGGWRVVGARLVMQS